jgi:hypothetical protein
MSLRTRSVSIGAGSSSDVVCPAGPTLDAVLPRRLVDGLVGGAVAGVVSGLPSTLHTLVRGGDVLASTRAAGTLLGRRRSGVPAGALVHATLSLGWGAVLGLVLPRRSGAAAGAVAGLAIAGLDLGVAARRRLPAVAALPALPQVADHVAFGAVVALVVGRLRSGRG